MLGDGYHDIPLGKLAAVVTYLEMTSPAPLRPAPEIAGTEIRRVNTPNVDWYRDLFSRVGTREWLWLSRMDLSKIALAEILNDSKVKCYAMRYQGRDEALLELDFRQPQACEIAFFGTTRTLIGTGAGRMLMNQAIQTAWSEPIERLHVHTCTLDHPSALAFYQRSGFVPVRQQIEIADDPRADGTMSRDAGPHIPIFK
ncbi:MAG: GNAT family N-acetyltransferase [Paracoccaceae bacterium]